MFHIRRFIAGGRTGEKALKKKKRENLKMKYPSKLFHLFKKEKDSYF